jgi:hypothetical protein
VLKALAALLLLANAVFFGWTQGWLDDWIGVRSKPEREPERLARQVRPQSVVILSPTSARAAAAAMACLEAGPFSPAEVGAAEAVLQPVLPAGSWTNVRVERPPVWIVYMGKYDSPELLARKREEAARTRIEFEELRNAPDLEPGLVFGRFDSREAAERALAQYVQRGLRSAKVVELISPSVSHMLRVERASSAVLAQATALRHEALGKGFSACAGPDAPR